MTAIRRTLGIVLTVLLIAGCAGSSKNEFTIFAQAGSGYAEAVDKLLVAAGTAQVDSTSWSLVDDKRTTGMDHATYDSKSKQDLARLEEIARLRRHAQLLGRYFGLLEALATSDAPERTEEAITGVVSALSDIATDLPPATSALPGIGEMAADLKIRAALRKELDQRKDTIRNHLEIQERLLSILAGQIKRALSRNRNHQEQILVMGPILSKEPLKNPEKWVSTRREIMYAPLAIDELAAAAGAAKKLREAFEGVISGETTIGRLNALITDIEGLLSIAETIES